jgi:hypothetical protein
MTAHGGKAVNCHRARRETGGAPPTWHWAFENGGWQRQERRFYDIFWHFFVLLRHPFEMKTISHKDTLTATSVHLYKV